MDGTIVSMKDLGSNFFCAEADVGRKSRAEASLPHLQQLNPDVAVVLHSAALTEALVSIPNVFPLS